MYKIIGLLFSRFLCRKHLRLQKRIFALETTIICIQGIDPRKYRHLNTGSIVDLQEELRVCLKEEREFKVLLRKMKLQFR